MYINKVMGMVFIPLLLKPTGKNLMQHYIWVKISYNGNMI